MQPPPDWDVLAKSKKLVRTVDQRLCGNMIAEYKDNIIIIQGAIKSQEYIIPKCNVKNYNEKEIYLDIPYDMLSNFEF
jgi:hypothetical protein